MTALKMILVGEIKKHIELNDSKYALDNAGYSAMRTEIMAWAVKKRLEKSNDSMDVDGLAKDGLALNTGTRGTGESEGTGAVSYTHLTLPTKA